MISRLLIMIVIIILSFTVCGCWDRDDPELLGLVLVAAFDYDPETGQYHVIAQLANPLAQEGEEGESGAGGGEDRAFWVISADGRSPFEAMRNLAEGTSRELFWAHNAVTLFSEELARRGLQPVLDLFEREQELRLITRPLVVEGDLRTLMEAKFPLEESGGVGLQRQVITIEQERGTFPLKFMTELYSTLEQPGIELFIGRVRVLDEGNGEGSEGTNEGNGEDEEKAMAVPPAKIGGGAAFKGDRMVGWVEPDHTIGWNHVMNRIIRDIHLIESPEGEGVLLAVETTNEESRLEPVVNKDELGVKITLRAEAVIQEYMGQHELAGKDEFTRTVAQRTAEALRNHIREHIERSQELNSDVLGLGNLFYRKKPAVWQEIEDDWDEIFPELQVIIDVEMTMKRTGLVTTPVQGEGS